MHLPPRGHLLVSTDLHGNLEDFRALKSRFESAPDVIWVQLGDVVHGPDDESRRERPALYDYPDDSMAIVDGMLALKAAHPDRFHYVLGNHDHGHVGGPHPSKFHDDEVEALERDLSPAKRAAIRALFADSLFAVATPCGLLLTHGVPSDELRSLAELDTLSLDVASNTERANELLKDLLTSYGQQPDVVTRMLAQVSLPGETFRVLVHGHDRDEAGYYVDGTNCLGLCIFGAPRENKRALFVDLAATYRSTADLRDGVEIVRLHATRR